MYIYNLIFTIHVHKRKHPQKDLNRYLYLTSLVKVEELQALHFTLWFSE